MSESNEYDTEQWEAGIDAAKMDVKELKAYLGWRVSYYKTEELKDLVCGKLSLKILALSQGTSSKAVVVTSSGSCEITSSITESTFTRPQGRQWLENC
jgi:hypothetical protein